MKRVKVVLAAVLGTVAVLMAPVTASAHPLGNFTVNRYAGIEIAGSEIYLRYALDLAEIPTYQLGGTVRQPGYASRLGQQLELTLDGRRATLAVVERRASSRPGAGGLRTLRLDIVYRASGEGRELVFVDKAFPGRNGWGGVKVGTSLSGPSARMEGVTIAPTTTMFAVDPDPVKRSASARVHVSEAAFAAA